VEDPTRVAALWWLFPLLLSGNRNRSELAGFEEIMNYSSSVPANALLPLLLNGIRNIDGFANCVELGERLISFGNKAGCAAAYCPDLGTAAMSFDINDGGPCDGQYRC
jgi:hypothetical protein